MFVDFLFHLRQHGLKTSTTEWLTLMKALSLGHTRANLTHFYHLSRATLVKKEGDFDRFDHAFSTFFKDIDEHFELDDDLLEWLSNPILPRALSPEELAALEALDLDELRQKFEERLQEQDERHDGGNRWVGTGGTSPFGHGGTNPAGVRVGGSGGSRSAVQIAMDRRFKDLRKDRILDTRQIGLALRRLRKLSRHQGRPELDIEETIQESARNAGEIDLVFRLRGKTRLSYFSCRCRRVNGPHTRSASDFFRLRMLPHTSKNLRRTRFTTASMNSFTRVWKIGLGSTPIPCSSVSTKPGCSSL